MEISDIVYLAFSTIMVVVILHVGVFWVSRLIQPPKPKIVYVDRAPPIIPEVVSAPILPTPPPPVAPPAQSQVQPQPQPQSSMAREMPQVMSVPTYDMPPPIVQSNKPQGMAASPTYDMPQPNKPNTAGLPPPIETRDVDRVGFSGGKGGAAQ